MSSTDTISAKRGFGSASRRWMVYAVIWGALLLIFAVQLEGALRLSWERALRHSFSQFLPWAIAAPLVIWLANRVPVIQRKHRFRNLLFHAVVSIVVAIVAQTGFEKCLRALSPRHPGGAPREMQPMDFFPVVFNQGRERPPRGGPLRRDHRRGPPPGLNPNRLLRHLDMGLPIYWSILGFESILLSMARLRRKEHEALQLQHEISDTRLKQLQNQLQPHFLFNTLNAISTLIHMDPAKADEAVGHLSTLLRSVLEHGDEPLLPLREELDLLQAYLEIVHMRFPGKLVIEQGIDDDCVGCLVPVMLFQPLVENSLKHGFRGAVAPNGRVWISASRTGDWLTLRVDDNGHGLEHGASVPVRPEENHGIGLANIRTRLHTLFEPDKVRFQIGAREDEAGRPLPGARVEIRIPATVSGEPPKLEGRSIV